MLGWKVQLCKYCIQQGNFYRSCLEKPERCSLVIKLLKLVLLTHGKSVAPGKSCLSLNKCLQVPKKEDHAAYSNYLRWFWFSECELMEPLAQYYRHSRAWPEAMRLPEVTILRMSNKHATSTQKHNDWLLVRLIAIARTPRNMASCFIKVSMPVVGTLMWVNVVMCLCHRRVCDVTWLSRQWSPSACI
jgi:hypothetical protein